MVRINLFKKQEEVKETKTEQVLPVPEPPRALDTRKTEPEAQVQVQYVEREVTLSLLNDKLNYLTARVEELFEDPAEDGKKSPPV